MKRSLTTAVAVAVAALQLPTASVAYDASAWQTTGGSVGSMQWPEDEYLEGGADGRTDGIGMSLSGGGDRSYVASIGYLSAMHALDLIKDVTYLVGVSGGSWATTVYSFYQNDAVDDATMLGDVVFPEDITYENLGVIEAGCVRAFVNSSERLPGPDYTDWADFVQVA
jgi:hypothetical protein